MTNIRAKGFRSKLELGEELAELEQVHNLYISPEHEQSDDEAILREVGWLRKEVADMQDVLSTSNQQTAQELRRRRGWSAMQLAAAIGAPLLFGVVLSMARLKGRPSQRKWTA